MTLSDSFCVDRHRREWLDLFSDKVDLVFANESEITSLFETDDFDAAARKITDLVPMAAITPVGEGVGRGHPPTTRDRGAGECRRAGGRCHWRRRPLRIRFPARHRHRREPATLCGDGEYRGG